MTIHAHQAVLQRVLQFSALRLDGTERRPRVWAAILAGAGLGLGWGIAARIWMRLISTNPSFSIPGTLAILVIATLFGAWTGLAFAARRRGWRGWRGWRHYLPRVLGVIFFIPFGAAGGLPLMLTVLLGTLGICQQAIIALWTAAVLTLVAIIPVFDAPPLVGGVMLVSAAALTAWKWAGRRWLDSDRHLRIDRWLERLGRGLVLLLALGIFGLVAHEVASGKPGWPAVLYMVLYFVLLYALHCALRISIEPRAPSPADHHSAHPEIRA